MQVPKGHLVPGVEGRRQYVQWALDLHVLQHNNIIDLGSGPVVIMARLLSEINSRLTVYCTEIDKASVIHAQQNVINDRIHIHQATNSVDLLTSLMSRDDIEDVKFDFLVCNPPFYDLMMRNSVATEMTQSEGFFPGGEVSFCKLLIDQSWMFRKRLKWSTCLLGHKSNLHAIKAYCWRQGAKHVATAVFCPNKTRRWAIAWTFHPNLAFTNSCSKPKPLFIDIDNVNTILAVMSSLDIQLQPKEQESYAAQATKNTWSRKARRKRRRGGGGGGGEEEENQLETNIKFTIKIRPWGSHRFRVFFNPEDHNEQLEGLVSHIKSKLAKPTS